MAFTRSVNFRNQVWQFRYGQNLEEVGYRVPPPCSKYDGVENLICHAFFVNTVGAVFDYACMLPTASWSIPEAYMAPVSARSKYCSIE